MRVQYSIGLLLVGVTLAIFWQIRNHEFVWSDRAVIVQNLNGHPSPPANPSSRRATPRLAAAFTRTIWGAIAGFSENVNGDTRRTIDPRPFHQVSIVVHVLSVLVVFAIVRLLVRDDWAAGTGALLFAVHPLQVESVASASGMIRLFGGLLTLVAIWQYLVYAFSLARDSGLNENVYPEKREGQSRLHYVAAVFAFVLAIVANPVAVAALFIIGILDYAFLERSVRQRAISLGAWLAVALVFAAMAVWVQPASRFIPTVPFWQRPLIAGDALTFYLEKLLVPFRLSVDYGRSPTAVVQYGWIYFAWAVPAALGIILWLGRRRTPQLSAAAAVFAVSLLPVLGFVPFGFQSISTVADRYVYVALLGPALALAWAVSRWKSKPELIACAICLAVLSFASGFQARLWKTNTSLFSHALALNSHSWLSHYHLGLALAQQGALEDAEQHYRQALRLRPDYARAQYALGNVLATRGNFAEAIELYRKVLRAGIEGADVHYYLGNIFAKLNRLPEAAEQYERSLQINRRNAAAHASLGHVLFRQRKLEDAVLHYREALEIQPETADAHYGLANILATRGELDQAMDHYQSALRINPSYAGAYYNLGTILARRGRLEDAIRYFREALKIRPDFADAHESLGRALVLQGKREEGMQHIQEALRILKGGRGTEPPQ